MIRYYEFDFVEKKTIYHDFTKMGLRKVKCSETPSIENYWGPSKARQDQNNSDPFSAFSLHRNWVVNFQAMNSLGCFKDKEKLKEELLKPAHNTGNYTHWSARPNTQLQKKWYTSCCWIARRENRPTKMRQRSWSELGAGRLTLPGREWITVNWTASPTISSARDPQSRPGGTSTGPCQEMIQRFANFQKTTLFAILFYLLTRAHVELRDFSHYTAS